MDSHTDWVCVELFGGWKIGEYRGGSDPPEWARGCFCTNPWGHFGSPCLECGYKKVLDRPEEV